MRSKNWLKSTLLSTIVLSGASVASSYTANFNSVADLNSAGSSFSLNVGGVDVTVSGWSDTAGTSGPGDLTIRSADLDKFGSNGWGIDNADENCNTSNDGICGTEHSADNWSSYSSEWHDYDMFLIQFSSDVSLESAGFGWLYDRFNSEVSYAAIDSGLAGNLDGNSWSSVLADTGMLWSDSSSINSTKGQDSALYDASINAGQTTSQYWLVGAYNSAFNSSFTGGSNHNDGMKLASIGFTLAPPDGKTEVPEPLTALLFGAGLVALGIRRRR